MQPKLIFAIILFLGSYFPLSLILLIQDVKKEEWGEPFCWPGDWGNGCHIPFLEDPLRSIGFFVVCIVCLAFLFVLLSKLRPKHVLQVGAHKAVPNDLINYVFPYVAAFMALELNKTGSWVGFLVFLAWMFVITYRSGQLLMNPLLIVAGWQIYEIDAIIDGNKVNVRAMSRFEPDNDKSYGYFGLQDIRVLLKEEFNGKTIQAGGRVSAP